MIETLYEELADLREQHAARLGLEGVFRTYVGPEYESSNPRLMLVGKATAGWCLKGERPTEQHARDFIEQDVIADGFTSAFWVFLRQLSIRLHKMEDSADNGTGY